MQNEFSRSENIFQLAETGKPLKISATGAERKALAARAGIPAIKRLEADLKVSSPENGVFLVSGTIRATVTLECSRTLEPFDRDMEEGVDEGFIVDEVLSNMDPDEAEGFEVFEPFSGEEVDLGEMAAQVLILAIDPFPILEGDISEKISTSGVNLMSEEEAKAETSPFSELKKLQKKS